MSSSSSKMTKNSHDNKNMPHWFCSLIFAFVDASRAANSFIIGTHINDRNEKKNINLEFVPNKGHI